MSLCFALINSVRLTLKTAPDTHILRFTTQDRWLDNPPGLDLRYGMFLKKKICTPKRLPCLLGVFGNLNAFLDWGQSLAN